MDELITLIFIIIAVLSVLSKIQLKKKSDAKSEASEGWIAKLNTFLTDLQEKAEQQANANSSSSSGSDEYSYSSGWDEFIDDEEDEERSNDADEYSLKDLVLEEDKPALAVKKAAPQPLGSLQARPKDRRGAPPKVTPPPALDVKKTKAPINVKSSEELRQAIIWSEILGPPVALRDPAGNQR